MVEALTIINGSASMKNIFTEHPHDIGETYFQHLKFAVYIGFNMIVGGLALLIHAIFPFLFLKTGSRLLFKMTHRFVDRTPRIENHVAAISKLIEKKMATANENSI